MNNHRVTADSHTLMEQGPMTASLYLRAAVKAVEDQFGVGGAAAYPQLVAAHMNAAAMDFGASVIARAIEAVADREPPYPMA